MGCALTKTQDEHATEQIQLQLALGEVYVFVPGLRLPKRVDFAKFLKDQVPSNVIMRLTTLRSKVATAAEDICRLKPNKSPAESNIYELQTALENYLAALSGMISEDLSNHVEFGWVNQEDEIKETRLPNVYYELLSVLHLLGILSLLEANTTLTPKPHPDHGSRLRLNEERKAAVDMLLKGAQFLDYAIKHVVPRIPENLKTKIPADIQEGSLKSLQMQALGQGVEIQLGLAMDDLKATLAVKRRLACEGAKYWQMAYEYLQQVHLGNGWGEKHVLFLKWKRAASKAAAYYYHGLVLEEGIEKNSHAKAVACLQAAETYLTESQMFCTEFSAAAPTTKKPPLWGAMKTLSDKIPKEAASKTRANRDVDCKARVPEKLPELPDFPLSLQCDEYELPAADPMWAQERRH